MRYLIDTNICIYVINKRPVEIIRKFKEVKIGDIGISSITVAELQYGVSKSSNKERNRQRLNEFLAPFEILSFDEVATKHYGDVRAQLERSGKVIGTLDMLIAAHALSKGLIVVTNNEKEFKRVKGLSIENWNS